MELRQVKSRLTSYGETPLKRRVDPGAVDESVLSAEITIQFIGDRSAV